MTVELPADYKPSPDEEYMNPQQLEYFRQKLLAWRDELMVESQETIEHLRDQSNQDVGDEADRANRESEHGLELRTRDRYRKLLRKIEQALGRIDDGSYGYCEDTGEEIGVGRLDARPIATLTVDAQERREMKEKVLADR
jgi:DnaK suppressor protein